MTTIRQIASQSEIEYLVKNDLILPEMADEEASAVVEEDGATFLTIDGDLTVAIYPAVEPNAWRE